MMNPMTPPPQYIRYFSGFTLLSSLVLFNLLFWGIGYAVEPSRSSQSFQGSDGEKIVQDQIDLANQWAKNGDYAKAITVYERVVEKFRDNKTLQRNLVTLYINLASQRQAEGHPEESIPLLNKALALSPNDSDLHALLSQGYLLQARGLRQKNGVTAQNMPELLALLDQSMAAYPSSSTTVQEEKANLYCALAQEALSSKALQEALTSLKKCYQLTPESSPHAAETRASLIQLLVKVGNGFPEMRPQVMEDLKALGVSPENFSGFNQKPSASVTDSLSPKVSQIIKSSSSVEGKVSFDAVTAKLSIQEMLSDIEGELGLDTHSAPKGSPPLSLFQRLERAESMVYGKSDLASTNPSPNQHLSLRTKKLYTALLAKPRLLQEQGSKPDLVQAPLGPEAEGDTYVAQIFQGTEGKVIRWGKFPLKIYIEPAPKGKEQYGFKPSYQDAVKAGIESWRVSSDTFLKFIYVKNALAADVQISWVPKYTDRFAQANVVPERYRNYAVPKANPAYALLTVASMLTPGYFRLAPQLVGSALQMRRMHQLQVIMDESKMQLGIQDLENRPESEALILLQNRAAHEFGHVLGLKGHSPDEKDLMYPELKTQSGVKPTTKDWNTLMNLYQRPANLVLNVH